MSHAKEEKEISNLKLAAWRPYPLLPIDMEWEWVLLTGGGTGREKTKAKDANKKENIGNNLNNFFSFELLVDCLHILDFSWFFIVFMIPV